MFFLASARSCCRWHASTMFSSTTAFPAAAASTARVLWVASEQARAISLASAGSVEDARSGGSWRMLAGQSTPRTPSSTSCWRVRATVSTAGIQRLAIWLSLHPRRPRRHRPSAGCALSAACAHECLPVRISVLSRSRSSSLSFTTYLLTAACFVDTESSPAQPMGHRFEETAHCQ